VTTSAHDARTRPAAHALWGAACGLNARPVETLSVTHFPLSRRATRIAVLACAACLGACSSVENLVSGDKIDYRSAGAPAKTTGLDIPPDLTQLTRDSRYQLQGGSVSASSFQAGVAPAGVAAVATAASAVAPQAAGDLKVERLGNQRWLSTPMPPEAIWPQLETFWKDRGFTLTMNDAEAGVMETEWAENRAKLPNDIIRNTIGKVFSSLYSTGERDRFRTRVERTPRGSEIYVSHRGLTEVYSDTKKESTVWQPRPADPQLEAEMLARLMSSLAPIKTEQAKEAIAAATLPQTRARILTDRPASTLQVDDNFERAWRRVGLALDRSGFTVEDRDRAQGLYFVRYVDPASAGKEGPGFFARIFGSSDAKVDPSAPVRYRVAVKGEGEASTVSVLNAQGAPENGDAGRRIVALLVEDLK
jgi:outer membrane protein assembly factor BamC